MKVYILLVKLNFSLNLLTAYNVFVELDYVLHGKFISLFSFTIKFHCLYFYAEWIRSKKKLSIGVMSPYAGQVVVIRDKIGNRYDKLDGFIVKVKIVDDYQGGEEDVVILSTVLSNFDQSENFILTPQRISVALTRARYGIT